MYYQLKIKNNNHLQFFDYINGKNNDNYNLKLNSSLKDIIKTKIKEKNVINIKIFKEIKSDKNFNFCYYFCEIFYCHKKFYINNICIFKSIKETIYLVYIDDNSSIICINLNNNKKITEIRNFSMDKIIITKHCIDKNNKRDLILTSVNNKIELKIWNINNWDCIFKLTKKEYLSTFFIIPCFLNYNNEILIVTELSSSIKHNITIYDLNKNIIKNIEDDDDFCDIPLDIESYYDKTTQKYYIITGNSQDLKSFDFNEGKLYKYYCDSEKEYHNNFIIFEDGTILKLIDASFQGILYMEFSYKRIDN